MSLIREYGTAWDAASWKDRGAFLLLLVVVNVAVDVLWAIVKAVWP